MSVLIPFALLVASGSYAQLQEAEIKAVVDKAAEKMHMPGVAWAVMKDGKVIYQGARGLANVEFDIATKVETPFLIASVTKQFTAAAIMKLVEESKIHLDAKISTYLTDAPESWSEITVRQLLTHTAGLTDRWEEEDMAKWRTSYPKSVMYDLAKAKKPLDKPGDQLVYSDQGYFLLGLIIENVAEKEYPDYLAETFFKPLGMNASRTEDLLFINPGLASGYFQVQGHWFRTSRRTQYGMTSHYGVVSTVGDLAKWSAALMGGKVLKPESLQKMWTPAMLANGGAGWVSSWNYGFGWMLREVAGRRVVQHAGSTGTNLTLLPDQKLAIVVLTNLEQATGGDATSISKAIYEVLYPDMKWSSMGVKAGTNGFENALKEEITRLTEGKMDENLYGEPLLSMIKANLPAQKAAMSAFGPLSMVQWLHEQAVGKDTISSYRVTFKETTKYAVVVRNQTGKIIMLRLESN